MPGKRKKDDDEETDDDDNQAQDVKPVSVPIPDVTVPVVGHDSDEDMDKLSNVEDLSYYMNLLSSSYVKEEAEEEQAEEEEEADDDDSSDDSESDDSESQAEEQGEEDDGDKENKEPKKPDEQKPEKKKKPEEKCDEKEYSEILHKLRCVVGGDVTPMQLLRVLRKKITPDEILNYVVKHRQSETEGDAIQQLCDLETEIFQNAFPKATKQSSRLFDLPDDLLLYTQAQFVFCEPQVGTELNGAMKLFLPVYVKDERLLDLLNELKDGFNIGTEQFVKMFVIFEADWIQKNLSILIGRNKTMWVRVTHRHITNKNVLGFFVSVLPNSRNASILINKCPSSLLSHRLVVDRDRFDASLWRVHTKSVFPIFDQFSTRVTRTKEADGETKELIPAMREVLERNWISAYYDFLKISDEPLCYQLVSEKLESKFYFGLGKLIPRGICMIFVRENSEADRVECTKLVCDEYLQKKSVGVTLLVIASRTDGMWTSIFEKKYPMDGTVLFYQPGMKVGANTKLIVTDYNHIVQLWNNFGSTVSFENLIVEEFSTCKGKNYSETLFNKMIISNHIVLISSTTKIEAKVLNLLPVSNSSQMFDNIEFKPLVNFVHHQCLYFEKPTDDDAKFKPVLESQQTSSARRSVSTMTRARSTRGATPTRSVSAQAQAQTKVQTQIQVQIQTPASIDTILTNRNPKMFASQKVHYVPSPPHLLEFGHSQSEIMLKPSAEYTNLFCDIYAGGEFADLSAFNDLISYSSCKKRLKWKIQDDEKKETHDKKGYCGICLLGQSQKPKGTDFYAFVKCGHFYCEGCLYSWQKNVNFSHCPSPNCRKIEDNSIVLLASPLISTNIPAGESSHLLVCDVKDCVLNEKETFIFTNLIPSLFGNCVILTSYRRILERYTALAADRGMTGVSVHLFSDVRNLVMMKDTPIIINDISRNVSSVICDDSHKLHFVLYEHGFDRLLFLEMAKSNQSPAERTVTLYDKKLTQVLNCILSAEDQQQLIEFDIANDDQPKWKSIPRSAYTLKMGDYVLELQYGASGRVWKINQYISSVKYGETAISFEDIIQDGPQKISQIISTHKRLMTDELLRRIDYDNYRRFFCLTYFIIIIF